MDGGRRRRGKESSSTDRLDHGDFIGQFLDRDHAVRGARIAPSGPVPAIVRAALLVLLSLAACAPSTSALKPGYRPPALLAVLPMDNLTPDLLGPDVVRYWFDQKLQEKKRYSTLPIEKVDAGLRGLGVAGGEGLRAVTPQSIGEKLGVEAVVYGDLIEFTHRQVGPLNVRKVQAAFRMVDCRTGETLWTGRGSAGSEGAAAGASVLSDLKHARAALAEKAANSPLRTEVWDMVWNAIESLPSAR